MAEETIPGFSALKFKEEAQQRIYNETKDMTPEERLRYFREAAEFGPFANRWDQLPDADARHDGVAEEHTAVAA